MTKMSILRNGSVQMEEYRNGKIERILGMYTRLMKGLVIRRQEEADRYHVNIRTIQRDMDDIRDYLLLEARENDYENTIIYNRKVGGYQLEQAYKVSLSNHEILAVCKILLDSRALTKKEMDSLLDKLISCCVPVDNQKMIQSLISNEQYHYIQPQHGKQYLDKLWDIGQAIINNKYIEIKYQGYKDSAVKTRKLKPLGIMFSEYYFYMTAFIDDKKTRESFRVLEDSFPTIYRIDRIVGLKILEESFQIPYRNRFEEGEFRKRIQFMYGGKLKKIKFEYSGESIEAVLDRLPTAKILDELDGKYIVQAEVFGDGIDMWLRSQGNSIRRLD